MNKDDKIFLIASFMVIILLLFAVVSLYMAKESEKEKRTNLQRQVDGLSIEKQNLEAKVRDLELTGIQTASSIRFQEEKISALAKDLEDEKAVVAKNITALQAKEFEIQSLKTRIEEMKAEKLDMQKNAEKLNEDYLNIRFQLENLIKTKKELEKKARAIAEKEGVSLGTVVIKRSNN
ncbi:MAG: hypothetical protein WC404_05020 [Candidatus Omnitrophota bacterium]|jgi:cell division protein FtsL